MKTKKLNTQIGFGLIIASIIFILITAISYSFGYYFSKMLVISPTLILLGISIFLFPGATPPQELPKNLKVNYFLKQAPLMNKIAWIVFGLIGLIGGLIILFKYFHYGNNLH